jgi:hypothetical protein
MIIKSIAVLIEELKKLPQDSVPVASEPPFEGVRLVPQPDGKVLIASLRD